MKSAIFWILGVGLVVTIVLALPVIVPLVRYLLGSTTLVAQVATSSILVLLRANVLSRLVIGLIPSFVALLATIGLIGVVSSLRGETHIHRRLPARSECWNGCSQPELGSCRGCQRYLSSLWLTNPAGLRHLPLLRQPLEIGAGPGFLEPVMNFGLEMVDSRHGTKSLSE
jgi:hypothetical protein